MDSLELKIKNDVNSYTDIPEFIREKLYSMIPHSQDEIIDRCLSNYHNGFTFRNTNKAGICPKCKKIVELSGYVYSGLKCSSCGQRIPDYGCDTIIFSKMLFSADARLDSPTFFRIDLSYNLPTEKENLQILKVTRDDGRLSEFLDDDKNWNTLYLRESNTEKKELLNAFAEYFKYSGLDIYMKNTSWRSNPLVYCLMYLKYPHIELLIKTKYRSIVDETIAGYSDSSEKLFIRNFKKGKNLKEILAAPEWIYQQDYNISEINEARIIYKKYHPSKESFESFIQLHLRNTEIKVFKQILAMKYKDKPLYTFDKLVSYIGRCDMYQAISPRDCILILKDYLYMSISSDTEPDINSNSLKREHDIAVRNYKLVVDEIVEKKFIAKAVTLKKYEYENNNFKVIIPETPQDLINEGKNNRNCVGSYVNSFAEGRSKIFFIRKKANSADSYVTLEMRGDTVTQAYLSSNRTITDDSTLKFIENWREHLKSKKII